LAGLSDFEGLFDFAGLSDFAESPPAGDGEGGDGDVLDFSLVPPAAALESLDGLSALVAFLRASDG
jgi:hypothetical protein